MNPGGFSFEIEVRSGGTLVGRTPASLAACYEDVLFQEIVAGRHPNDGTLPAFDVSPVWDEDPPAVRAIAFGTTRRYEKDVFASGALRCITNLVKTGAIDTKSDLNSGCFFELPKTHRI